MAGPKVPQSAETEAALLGALMLDNQALQRIPALEPAAFYLHFHAEIFRAIQALAGEGKEFDAVTVFERMQAGGDVTCTLLEVHQLAQYLPSAHVLAQYADHIADRYRARQLMEAGSEIVTLATSPGAATAHIDAAQMLLAKLATVKARREPEHILQSMADYLAFMEELSQGKNPAMSTGISGLDRLLNGGLRPGEVLVIGARPKHGKTALALALARNLARQYPVLYLSQEMPITQLMHRHTAASGAIDLSRLLSADPEDGELWRATYEAARTLGELHLLHDDQCNLTLLDIRRKVLKVKREHGLAVLFVDFLQLMAGAGEESRNRELDVIVNGIKGLAMDLGIAVVLLSQMSRKADEHYGRPTMTHLRDSGAIEAAADQVALLFTDWAHPLSKRTEAFKGYSELEIVAHRNGPQGKVPLEFVGNLQQMGDWLYSEIPTHSAPEHAKGGRGRY